MQLEIPDKRLEKILSNADTLIRTVGLDMARIIKRRINEILSSSNFKEYLNNGIGKPHPLSGNMDGLFGICLNKNYRLIVEPITDNLDDEALKKCNKINIKGVVDYHGKKCEWLIP